MYKWRKKSFAHPTLDDWAEAERLALRRAAQRGGDDAFYDAARRLFMAEVDAYGGEAKLAARAPALPRTLFFRALTRPAAAGAGGDEAAAGAVRRVRGE